MTAIGNSLLILNTVDSTNNYAMAQVRAGSAHHGQVWFTREQTAGKGQYGKPWKTSVGENIMMSICLETAKLSMGQQFELSASMALAAHAFFARHAGKDCAVKWPNDLYWRDKKAGGILIENVIGEGGQWKWAVVGMGINIDQTVFDPALPNPVSLKAITGEHYDPVALAVELCGCVEEQWQRLMRGEWPQIHKDYNASLYKRGQRVRLKKGNVVMPCTIKGVTPEGRLAIEEDADLTFTVGEVEWLLNSTD